MAAFATLWPIMTPAKFKFKNERTNVYISSADLNALRAISADSGAPVAELIRRAIRLFVESKKKVGRSI
jgi:predicted DNA binding CopG/RHH family protein